VLEQPAVQALHGLAVLPGGGGIEVGGMLGQHPHQTETI